MNKVPIIPTTDIRFTDSKVWLTTINNLSETFNVKETTNHLFVLVKNGLFSYRGSKIYSPYYRNL